jgi:hypothetical protein
LEALFCRTQRINSAHAAEELGIHGGIPQDISPNRVPPELLKVGVGYRFALQDEAVGGVLVQRIAEFHYDISQLGGQGRMEQECGCEIVPFLQEMTLREGHEWETL